VITLFAVTWRADAPTVDRDGLDVLSDGNLAMIVGPTPSNTSREDALAFGRVVERFASAVDVLPFRYGTTAPDAETAQALLREHESSWTARLLQVEGCSELAIRAARREQEEDPAVTGAQHLARLVSRSRQLDAAEEEIGRLLTGRCRVVRRLAGHQELRLSCLVERHQVELLRLLVEEWAASQTELEVSVTGPWAPYSFVANHEEAG
jgi:hypothetical protein